MTISELSIGAILKHFDSYKKEYGIQMATGLFADFAGPKESYDGIKYADYKWLYDTSKGKPNSDVVLAEVSNTQKKVSESTLFRDNLRDQGFVIGMYSDMAKYPSNLVSEEATTYYDKAWGYVAGLSAKSGWSSLSMSQKAKQILTGPLGDNQESIFLYPDDQLQPSEYAPSAGGGYCFWSQDIEADSTLTANSDEVKKQFAGIITALWAGRHFLGSNFKIIPVISKSVITNLENNVGNELVNLESVHNLVAPILNDQSTNPLNLKYFNSGDAPSEGDHKRTSWSLMSYLKMNGIIDGFISEETRSIPLQPGGRLSLNSNAAPFHPKYDIPYALMGYWNGPGADMPQSSSLAKKIKIDFHGALPLNSAMYFVGDSELDNFLEFLPDQYFDPVSQHLFSVNASQYQYADEGGYRVIDLTTLSSASKVQISIDITREADYQSYSGFYRVQDAIGTVLDPISGQLLVPGQFGYETAALADVNRISDLSHISLRADGSNSFSIDLAGGFLMAPFCVVTEAGHENAFFSYASANPDNIGHFKQLSVNSFGMEDMLGGGDMDFNDLVISFQFLAII